MSRNNNILIPRITPSLQLQCMFPLPPWEAEMAKPLWLFLVYSEEEASTAAQAGARLNKMNGSASVRFDFRCLNQRQWKLLKNIFRFSLWWFQGGVDAFCCLPSHRNERGSNGPDDDSKRWFWGHCLDALCRELPQPFPPSVAFFLLSPVRHHLFQEPTLLMESR